MRETINPAATPQARNAIGLCLANSVTLSIISVTVLSLMSFEKFSTLVAALLMMPAICGASFSSPSAASRADALALATASAPAVFCSSRVEENASPALPASERAVSRP